MPSSQTGITFKNILSETDEFNILTYGYIYNGGGVSVGDVNNDGLQDLYFTGSMVGSRLYINKGNFEFDEVAEEAGVFAAGLWNTGTTMVDINADGLLDIYVCRSAAADAYKRKNLLFVNNGPSPDTGHITFTEKAAEYGIDDAGYSTQGAFFDYDKDGDLDLYVVNHSTQEFASFRQITKNLKSRRSPDYEDRLYRNDNGNFTNVSDAAGLVSNVLGFGLSIAVSDVNNDNWPDIYISNDFNEQDYLYINNQDGTFSEKLEKYIGHSSHFSMGSDIADINNDGYPEIMTLDMLPEGNYRLKMVSGPDNYDKNALLVENGFYHQSMRNMLHLNQNGKYFSEIGQFSGISNTDWSWASLFTDLDNDGFKDLFITNGLKRDYTNMDFMNYAVQEKINENKTGVEMAITDLLKNMPSTVEENYTYHNNGDLTFSKVNSKWGLDQKSLSNGAAYADLDNDGDMDLVVSNTDEHPFVYRNNSELFSANNYLKITLKGQEKNTFGIGAKVELQAGGKKFSQEMMPTRGFQSSVDYNLIFGIGDSKNIEKLTIRWPNDEVQIVENVQPNQTLVIVQEDARKTKVGTGMNLEPYFSDITADSLILYSHKENSYNDFKREQLLPHKLSTQGPKLAKGDANNDGLEDIFIGGGKGQPGKIWVQSKDGKFSELSIRAFNTDSQSEDVGSIFFDADGDSDLDLYVVSGGNAFEEGDENLQDRLYFNDGQGNYRKSDSSLPPMITSGSCVIASDYDQDGDIDLFVGGRLVTGKYPTSPRSYMLRNDGRGNFNDATPIVSQSLEYPGMVTDAIWSDFNGDGTDDLIVVGEFMKIRLFENRGGKLTEFDDISGLLDSQGWWNSIEQGDFDNDGDMDYIAGNFGLNSQLRATPSEPVQLYVNDFDKNGSLDPILCSYIQGENYPVFSKDDLVGQLSGLKNKYVNYSDYANQKITDIFTEAELAEASLLEAKTFTTSYLENLGNNKFKLSPLPYATQFSPVYAILVQDFNDDGNLDVLLTGNFFGSRVKYGRYDANKGVLLIGDGKGNFSSTSNLESGLQIDGEVRDATIITLSSKSQLLLFARNDEDIKVYKRTNP